MEHERIMVIDDSPSLREMVGCALRGAGYEVVEAEDGRDALAKLSGRGVDLIICDVHMPAMDGLTFVREIKRLEPHRATPVIMLTTDSLESRKLQGQVAGARAWIVKPFRPDQLLHAVSRLIAR